MLDLFPRDTEELARSLVFFLLDKLVLTSEKLLPGPPLIGTTLARPEQMRLYKSGSSAAHAPAVPCNSSLVSKSLVVSPPRWVLIVTMCVYNQNHICHHVWNGFWELLRQNCYKETKSLEPPCEGIHAPACVLPL